MNKKKSIVKDKLPINEYSYDINIIVIIIIISLDFKYDGTNE